MVRMEGDEEAADVFFAVERGREEGGQEGGTMGRGSERATEMAESSDEHTK